MIESATPPTTPIEDEIDLLSLAKTLWNGRKTVIKSIAIFGIIGLLVAITSPKEYEATTIMVPSGSSGGNSMGGLGGLAAIAGINISTPTGGELSPMLYPQIISSLPYQLELMKTPLNFSELKEPISLVDYYTEIQKPNLLRKYTIGLPKVIIDVIISIPGTILSSIRGSDSNNDQKKTEISEDKQPIKLTGKQQTGRGILSNLISLTVNSKGSTLTLTSIMHEPLAAAQLGKRAQELLQQYIIEFRIKKAKANLDFMQQRYDEITLKYEALQQQLASFNDRNKNVSLASAKTEEVRLTSQYNLIFSIYSELAKQLEQAKIQIKQDTPVFTIIEPITVPATRSSPDRPRIILIWLLAGGFLGIALVFGKVLFYSLKSRWEEA